MRTLNEIKTIRAVEAKLLAYILLHILSHVTFPHGQLKVSLIPYMVFWMLFQKQAE